MRRMNSFGPAASARRAGLAVALLLAAGPAAAAADDCPLPDDLGAGVFVSYADGVLSRFVRDAGGRVFEDAFFDPDFAEGYRYVTAGGLLPLVSYDILDGLVDPDSRTDTDYPMPEAVFPAPAAGLVWRAEAEVRSQRDGNFRQLVTLNIGSPREARYGECAYEVLPVTLRFQDEISDSEEHLDFVLALGIAVFRAGGVTGQDYDVHDPVAIFRGAPAGLPEFRN
jgi:hypothetical protein